MTAPQRHDWPKLIAELENLGGITPYRLAWRLEIDYKTLVAYAEGHGEPRHSVGELILALHAESVPRETLGEIPPKVQHA